ncbi:MAG: hypothetical protein PHW95_05465 [Patescibacteria group bacterium]|nr:hypothetical protein [Patescibacteria group bacterium]
MSDLHDNDLDDSDLEEFPDDNEIEEQQILDVDFYERQQQLSYDFNHPNNPDDELNHPDDCKCEICNW